MVNVREKLRGNPLLATIVLILLYTLILFAPDIVLSPLRPFVTDIPYFVQLLIGFIVSVVFHLILWHFIVPFGLKLPNGKETLNEYHKSILLSKIHPLKRNILLGLSFTAVYFLSFLCGAFLLGNYVFDLNVLFGTPEPATLTEPAKRGWFLFFFAFIPGIWEEIAFRGVILPLFLRKYSEKKSIIANGIIFGAMHSINAIFLLLGGMDIFVILVLVGTQMIYAGLIGILFAQVANKTQSLLPCIITHYLIDSVGALVTNATFSNPILEIIALTVFAGIIPTVCCLLIFKFIIEREEKSKE
ncbi:MAG: CPBP family intramembrane glutamic endopeptidase [Candidatus Hodarchaeota archaeon]